MARTACILTTFNRPKLVADAIASVMEQTDPDWRLYVMDDGSSPAGARAVYDATHGRLGDDAVYAIEDGSFIGSRMGERLGHSTHFWEPGMNMRDRQRHDGVAIDWGKIRAVVWYGRDRDLVERKRTISYSRSINIALNYLLQDERYVAYLVDDDFLYPESIGARADYLDAHPDVHVVTGRQRSIQYDAAGFNRWAASADPLPGRAYPRPTGRRELIHNGAAAKTYFEHGDTDPQTGLPFVEEAFWQEGPHWYGKPFRHDHNSFMHRRECLTQCGCQWYGEADAGGVQYWGESFAPYGVGDANFLERLGAVHPFVGIDAWVATKRYHAKSDGVQTGPVRE